MTDPPNYDELAKRYLALWQEYIAGAAADPDAAKTMTAMMAGWQNFANAAGAAFAPGGPKDGPPDGPPDDRSKPGGNAEKETKPTHDGSAEEPRTDEILGRAADPPQPVSAADTVASGGTDDGLRGLHRRLAQLERRVERLEAENRAGRTGDP